MNQEERQQQYEDYIRTVSAAATAIGQRKPYSMVYIKKREKSVPVLERQDKKPEKERMEREDSPQQNQGSGMEIA